MISIRRLASALCLALCFSQYSNAQTVGVDPTVVTQTHSISDDGYANVPLQFNFPYYGQSFNNSWMFSNGIISFQDPNQSGMAWGNLGVQQFSSTMGSQFDYSIYPLWTDLINIQGTFKTEGNSNFQRYSWIGISPFYDSTRVNNFSVEIRPDGKIITNYTGINVDYASVGMTGNTSRGEYEQIAFSWSPLTTDSLSNWERYTQAVDLCSTNPLSSPTCSGYQEAYLAQQCSINTLFNSSCPGYEQAYFNQQCTINPLYNSSCPGYATAYFNQQCTINGLYDKTCPNYQSAFLTQQCEINQLYSTQCPGYTQAKLLKDLQEQQIAQTQITTEPSVTTSITSSISGSNTISSPTVALADPTRTETVITTDVGGVELTITGQISIPTGQTTATKESIKEATKDDEKREEQKSEKEKKRVDPRALAIAMAAVAATERTALATAEQAVTMSQSNVGPNDGTGIALGSGLSLQNRSQGPGNDQLEDKKDESSTNTNQKNNSADTINMNTITITSVPESTQKQGPNVRRGGTVEGMEGGPDPSALARAPLDFNQYLNAQLKDAQFYSSKEIYRGQRTVDNARAQRFLNGASDSLHQRMIEQQYQIGQ